MKKIKGNESVGFILVVLFAVVVVVEMAGVVSANEFLCLRRGETVKFSECNPNIADKTCTSSLCQLCVFVTSNGAYCPGNFNLCNSRGSGCSFLGESPVVDEDPPVMTINSPRDGDLNDDKRVFVDIGVNEISTIHYKDNLDLRARWQSLCRDCTSYSRGKNFDEGVNDITFRATDLSGNEAFLRSVFFVDSKEPKIRKTEPQRGFASGFFEVEVDEANLERVELHYGNSQRGMRIRNVDLGLCVRNRNYECRIFVDLGDFDKQEIDYFFVVRDRAGNEDVSRSLSVDVDSSKPVIESFRYEVDGRYVTFFLEVDEPFLEEIVYIDRMDSRAKEKTLCTRLKDGVCEKRVSFGDGLHSIWVSVIDESGNRAIMTIEEFFTDSRKPRIKRTEPSRGFASGFFEVEFTEENPRELVFHYGNQESGFGTLSSLDVVSDGRCVHERSSTSCEFFVSLGDFKGEEIEYWYSLSDKGGNRVESRPVSVDVDLTPPGINSLRAVMEGRRVEIIVDVDEENLEIIEYIDRSSVRPRWMRLCSRLREGLCSKRVTLREGVHDIDVQVLDEAGNSVGRGLRVVV